MKEARWNALVEEAGDRILAHEIWVTSDEETGKGEREFPVHIERMVASQLKMGMDLSTTVDQRELDKMDRMDRATLVVSKKLQAISNKPDPSDMDLLTIANLADVLFDMENIETEAAIVSFVNAADDMSKSSRSYLDNVIEGKVEPTLRQLYRIKEFGETFQLLEELIPELEADPAYAADAAKAREVVSKKKDIKTKR